MDSPPFILARLFSYAKGKAIAKKAEERARMKGIRMNEKGEARIWMKERRFARENAKRNAALFHSISLRCAAILFPFSSFSLTLRYAARYEERNYF